MGEKRLLKIVEKIFKNPKHIDFSDIQTLLIGFGYSIRQPSGGSSHYVFRKAGSNPISVPKAKPVNQTYVKQVIILLKLEDWYEEHR